MKIFVCSLLLAFSVSLLSQPDNAGKIALLNGVVITGDGTPALEGYSVIIGGDRILAIGKNIEIPPEAKVIDCAGKSILPGLIDMHGHLYGNTGMTIESLFNSYPQLYLAGGVTTIYSPGEFDPEGVIALKEKVNQGRQVGPHILTAGPYFDKEPSKVYWMKGVKDVEEAREKFRAWKDRIDGVKFYTSISKEQMRTVLVEAREAGLPITGHLSSVPAGMAIEMGISGLEHGIYGMSELWPKETALNEINCALADLDIEGPIVQNLIRLIVEKNIYIDPTIIVFEASFPEFKPVTENWKDYLEEKTIQRTLESFALSNQDTAALSCGRKALIKQKEFVKAVYDAGGVLVTGSDPIPINLIPGHALHREMTNFVELGVPELETIKAATFNAAKALKIENETGTLTASKRADVIVISGRPDKNIEDISNTFLVIKDGKIYQPEHLRNSTKGKIGLRSPDLLHKDILAAIQKIFDYTKEMTQEDFASDEKTQDAVMQNMLIIYQASSLLPPQYRDQYPTIPWMAFNALKDLILDQYYNLDAASIFWYFIRNVLVNIDEDLRQDSEK